MRSLRTKLEGLKLYAALVLAQPVLVLYLAVLGTVGLLGHHC